MTTTLIIALVIAVAAGALVSQIGKWADEAMDKIIHRERRERHE